MIILLNFSWEILNFPPVELKRCIPLHQMLVYRL